MDIFANIFLLPLFFVASLVKETKLNNCAFSGISNALIIVFFASLRVIDDDVGGVGQGEGGGEAVV